jgi:hypothetical protein
LVIWIHAQHVDPTRIFVFPEVCPRPTIANGVIPIEDQNDVPCGAVGKMDAVKYHFDRVGIVSPTAREGAVLKAGQSFFLAGVQRAVSSADLFDFRQRPLGKIHPEFKKSADECKTPTGEKPFSREAILRDVCVESHDTQLSRTVDSAID